MNSGVRLDDDGELTDARFEGERAAGESFQRARLVDVELVRCDLSGCDFSEATLHRSTFVDCRATGIDFGQAILRNVVFRDCKLDDANFRLARLEDVQFGSSVCTAAEFVGARLERVTFSGSDLTAVHVSQVTCTEVDLRDARVEEIKGVASLRGATIARDQLIGLAPALAHAIGLTVLE